MSNLDNARSIFRSFKTKFESEQNKKIVDEFVSAISLLLGEYNTAVYENRFIVGGAVEHIFVALLKALGFEAQHIGLIDKRSDLVIDGVKFSIKTNFTSGGDIRLVNKLGGGKVLWDEATIFLISELGLVYGDFELLGDKIEDKGDALVVSVRDVKEFANETSDFFISLDLPIKPDFELSRSRTASFDIARVILEKIQSKFLIKYL